MSRAMPSIIPLPSDGPFLNSVNVYQPPPQLSHIQTTGSTIKHTRTLPLSWVCLYHTQFYKSFIHIVCNSHKPFFRRFILYSGTAVVIFASENLIFVCCACRFHVRAHNVISVRSELLVHRRPRNILYYTSTNNKSIHIWKWSNIFHL